MTNYSIEFFFNVDILIYRRNTEAIQSVRYYEMEYMKILIEIDKILILY